MIRTKHKRFISITMAVILVFSLTGIPAFGEGLSTREHDHVSETTKRIDETSVDAESLAQDEALTSDPNQNPSLDEAASSDTNADESGETVDQGDGNGDAGNEGQPGDNASGESEEPDNSDSNNEGKGSAPDPSEGDQPASDQPDTDASSAAEDDAETSADDEDIDTPEDEIALMDAQQDIKDYFADPATATIVSGMQVTFQNAAGDPISDPTIDSRVNFNFGISIPGEVAQQVQAGDYYDINLPNSIIIQNAINNVELYDDNGILYGTFSVSPGSPARVRITFTDNVSTTNGVTGSLFFQGNLNSSTITTPGSHEITIPGETGLTAQINVKPQTGSMIDKRGNLNSTSAPTEVSWTIDFNKTLDTLTDATLLDTFPTGLILDPLPMPQVYQASVDLYGNVLTSPAPVLVPEGPDTYTVQPDGTIRFNTPITDCYQVRYTTPIEPSAIPTLGGQLRFTNQATLNANELAQPLTSTTTVAASFHRQLEKVNTASRLAPLPGSSTPPYVPTFDWLLRTNYQAASLPASTIIDDIYDDNAYDDKPIAFDSNSLHIYPVSFSANGSPVRDTANPLQPGVDYELSETTDPSPGPARFSIQLLREVTTPLDIIYSTYAPGTVSNGYSVPNNAAILAQTPPVTAFANTNVGQNAIGKRLVSIDRNNERLTWEVTLNENRYAMEALLFQDQLGQGLTYVNGSLSVFDVSADAPVLESDYSFVDPPPVADLLSFQFQGAYLTTDSTLRVTYQTHYDTTQLPASGFFENQALFTWEDAQGNHQSSSFGRYTPTQAEAFNGEKNGRYNAVDKTITWDVLVDYSQTGFKNAYIEDEILNQYDDEQTWQMFVPNSVRIYHYDIQNNVPVRGNELTEDEYANCTINEPVATSANAGMLRVDFPDDTDPPVRYWIEYQTSLQGKKILSNYQNRANLHNDLDIDHQLDASVGIEHGGNLLEKSGSQGVDGYAHWEVLINPSQSNLNTITVEDVPSANQTIVEESLVLYPGLVAESGTITPDTQNPLVNGTDYTYTYQMNSSNQMQLTVILFPNSAAGDAVFSRPYVMQYRASLQLASATEPVTNTANIVGTPIPGMQPGADTPISINTTDAGGILVGTRSPFSLDKQGIGGAADPLGDVTFHLYDRNGNKVGGDFVTDASGNITFPNVVEGSYYLREVSVGPHQADGYAISDELYNGLQINVTSGMPPVTIQNDKTRVVLTKYGDGDVITATQPGLTATYDLYAWDGSTFEIDSTRSPLTTDGNGQIIISGLTANDYELRETSAPSGFVLNTDPVRFTITADPVRGLAPLTELRHDNYAGRFTFMKTDNRGTAAGDSSGDVPLSGAEFTMTDSFGYSQVAYSDTDGMVRFTEIPPGSYLVYETADPPGWPGGSATYTIPVTVPTDAAGLDSTVDIQGPTVANTLTGGTVDIQKLSDEVTPQPLEGAVFDIVDASTDLVVRNDVTTNGDGVAIATGLPEGSYYIRETAAPDGYLLNTDTIPFTIAFSDLNGAPVKVGPITNYMQSATLQKTDEGGTGLAGAEFTLTDDATGQVVGSPAVSDESGNVRIDRLAPGDYTLTESAAPQGYLIDSTPIRFTVPDRAAGQPSEIALNGGQPFINYTGGVTFTKRDAAGNALSGAVFDLSSQNGSPTAGSYISGQDGVVGISGLAPGDYTLTETQAPEGFLRNTEVISFTVPLSAPGQPTVITLPDYFNYTQSAVLQKSDENGSALEDAEFTLTDDATGNVVGDPVISDPSGIVRLDGLAPGDYTLLESRAPAGYLIDSSPIRFTVPSEAAGQPTDIALNNGDPFINYKDGVVFAKTDSDGIGLAGAEFSLSSTNGSPTSGTYVSGQNGVVGIGGLAPGDYTLTESAAPNGFIRNTQTIEFTVPVAEPGEPPVIALDDYVNYTQSVVLQKSDEEGDPLVGAEFTLTDDASGETVGSAYTSDADGTVRIDKLGPGSYTLLESRAPQGFVINSTPIRFTVDHEADGQPADIALNNGDAFINYTAGVMFAKTDEGGRALSGAEFELSSENGSPTSGTYVSGQDGTVGISGLASGDYILTEIKAPTGYLRNTQPIRFTVPEAEPGEPAVILLDRFANYHGSVELRKENTQGSALAGAEFFLVRIEDGGAVTEGSYTSDANGSISIGDLEPGSYEFREQRAPQGYQRLDSALAFTVGDAADGYPDAVQVTAVNHPLDRGGVAATGDRLTILPLLALIVIGAIAMAGMAIHRRKVVANHRVMRSRQ